MKGLRQYIRNFFGFSRAQTNGFVALLLIMSVALFSKPLYHAWVSSQPRDFSQERKKLDSLTALWQQEQAKKENMPEKLVEISLFKFNPNTVTADELKTLGFTSRVSKGLLNYRLKGGAFRVKADLMKLYGMDSIFYQRIIPFIDLPDEMATKHAALEPKKELIRFNINEADTLLLQSVIGIGPVLAKRIVKYRERLGGFVETRQLKEVYGLDSVVIQELLKTSFLPENDQVRKININTADENVLSSHPYFSKKIARSIVTYRFQHGNYKSIDDLRKIELIDSKTAEKIYPYITVE